jgi:glycosyltransferase involved in cell wall biosynthesis
MNSTELISIVLPTYNGSRYLPATIESCLAQTHKNWELIIVDDASTDATPAQIARFAANDNRIRSMRHNTNRRVPAALNTGFARAKGAYLTWTSDDNCYRENALERMLHHLEAHPEIGMVYSDFTVIDADSRAVRSTTIPERRNLLVGNCIGPCFLYRRKVYEVTGAYAEDLFLADDYDYWLRVSARFQIEPLHEDLYLYREHGGALTARRKADMWLATERAIHRNLPTLEWASAADRLWIYRCIAHQARSRRDFGHAFRCYAAALPLLLAYALTKARALLGGGRAQRSQGGGGAP